MAKMKTDSYSRCIVFLISLAAAPFASGQQEPPHASVARSSGRAAVAGVQFAQAGSRSSDPRGMQANLDGIVRAAKQEGEVTAYVAPTGLGERIAEGFSRKYGVKMQFIRMPSVPLLQRYSTEAESGNIAADLIFNAGGDFADPGIKRGWLERIGDAGIPALASGEFPTKFTNGATAITSVAPWGIVYNTEKVKGDDVPRDWPDVLNAKFKGQILLSDPRSSDAYFDLWALLLEKYGDSFFSRLRAQNMRLYPSAAPTTQALGAGEGALMLINQPTGVLTYKKKGAPVDIVIPEFTTGVEIHVMLTARGRAKHPNAARLLAQYVLSPEGNKWMNDASISVYDIGKLPKKYQSPSTLTPAKREALLKLLDQ